MAEMAQPLQPELVHSATDDDDNSSDGGQEKALEYLLRYETMVRQQDAEDMATLAHLRPLLYRMEKLGGKESKDTQLGGKEGKETPQDMEDIMAREVTFSQLQRALQVLDNDSSHVMTTDRQLMLVLRTLAKKSAETDDECISWAEFYQCYKTVVGGMQTLQYIPSQSLVRSRTKDRTLTILSMFEPPSTKLFNEDVPRTIQTGEDEALEGDRHHVMPEIRTKRRIGMLFGLFLAAAALLCCVFLQSPYINNGKPILELDDVVSQVKTIAAPWLTEGMVTEVPRESPVPPPRDSFFHNFHALEAQTPSNDSETVDHPVTEEKSDVDTPVAVLAGASGVAVAPLLIKAATLLQTGGLPGMGAITIFTVALAPVIKGVDVMIGRLLRKLSIGKKK